MLRTELGVAIGADHEHSGLGQLLGEEDEQQQRRLVGRVQIVEDDDERLAARGAAQEGGRRVEEAEASAFVIEGRGRGQVG